MMSGKAQIDALLAELRKKLPCGERRVVVKMTSRPSECYGSTRWSTPGLITITLNLRIKDQITGRPRHVTFGELQDTILHEWAHAMTLEAKHGARWGKAYAKVYSLFFV